MLYCESYHDTRIDIMQDLADFLQREVDQTSYRAVEEKTGVSRGALEKIIKRQNNRLPELETLQKIATGFQTPLWRILEIAGMDLNLPVTTSERRSRLLAFAEQMPEFSRLLDALLEQAEAGASELVHGVLIYMETVEKHEASRMRNRPRDLD